MAQFGTVTVEKEAGSDALVLSFAGQHMVFRDYPHAIDIENAAHFVRETLGKAPVSHSDFTASKSLRDARAEWLASTI